MKKARLVRSNSETEDIDPTNGEDFSLQELKAIVGGYIEIVPIGEYRMVMNEEGKMLELPFNSLATMLFRAATHTTDTVVGDVLVCHRSQLK